MKKVQITGCATLIGSKNLSDEDKGSVLEAPDGHHIELRVKPSILKGKVVTSSAGSLMCRFSLQSEDFELVTVPNKVSKNASPEELQAQAEALL